MTFEKVREDVRVFKLKHQNQNHWLAYFYYPEFRTQMLLRCSQWCYKHHLSLLAYLITVFNDFSAGIWIGPQVEIGKGLFLGHARGVVINPKTKIGNYCTLVQQVGLGGPQVTLGNFVSIGAGAKIISRRDRPIEIGDFVIIGAGSVVTKNVPSFSVVAGVPAKRIRKILLDDIQYEWGGVLSAEQLEKILEHI
jgi:serine O-acetyltransferase